MIRPRQLLGVLLKDRAVLRGILKKGVKFGCCPVCESRTFFVHRGEWIRENYACVNCGSIPRFRAVAYILNERFPDWRSMKIHESSPEPLLMNKFQKECPGYTPTQYYPNEAPGTLVNGIRCEDLQNMTYEDEEFDLVITQDVLEHIPDPAAAFKEIARTLKPGGAHLFTVPFNHGTKTVRRAIVEGKETTHLMGPIYHGNPIDAEGGSLTITDWGSDMFDFIRNASGMTTEIIGLNDPQKGLIGQSCEVFVSIK